MTSNSNFSARADSAALALKGKLSETNRTLGRPEIQPRSVPVGPNGQPAPPLPPEGSYARQAIERQRQAAQSRQTQQLQTPEDLNSQQGQHEQNGAAQGHQQSQDTNQGQLSPNAQRRISELSQLLRQKDQELQQAIARSQRSEETQAQTQARLQAIEARFNSVVNQNLDSLDPETRQQVLNDAAIAESAARIEQRVMQSVAPLVERVTTQAIEAELGAVAGKYPAFSAEIHGPLIETFRSRNQNCTIEQAFRAVAEPDELVMGRQGRAPAVPPIAIPQSVNTAPRYVAPPAAPQVTPEQVLEADRLRAFQLARSTDPLDRRQAGRAMDQYLASKLKGALPGQRR